ncbi:MAG TPA: PQQ-binding-like beta-propeller repeat protein [Thermodesulfovibrionales bacterium]|jgi:outer membrane protein assembly factor BamB|nr:PQQ-binding-like beta-propeller repeat protein [Thermodesulfovibrionales bacterium]
MKKHISLFSLLAFCCMLALFLASCGGGGGGSSAFAKPGDDDNGVPGNGETDDGKLKWSFKADGPVTSSPAVSCDGTIYVGSDDGTLSAINPDGTLKWKYVTGGSIIASPSVSEDCSVVYVGSLDRQIYAINSNGTLKWVVPTKSLFTSSPAIGSDGKIYIGGTHGDRTIILCEDIVEGGEIENFTLTVQLSFLYAVSPNGTLEWFATLSGPLNSSPAIATDGTIYVGTDGDLDYDRSNRCDKDSIFPPSNANPGFPVNAHLYAINPNGTIKWDFKTLGDVDSSPAIGSDGTIYVGSDYSDFAYGFERNETIGVGSETTGYLYAVNPNGTLKWYQDLFGDVDSSPAIASDGTIYVGSDKNDVFALAPNGTILWSFPTRNDVNSSPAIGNDGTIYVGSDDGFLYALNPNGTEKWRYEAGSAIGSSPTIISNGIIYVGSSDGSLLAVGSKSTLMNSPWPKFRRDVKNHARQQ